MSEPNPTLHPDTAPEISAASGLTVAALFARRVAFHPDRVALVEGERRLTYRELDRRTNRLANALHQLGMRRGDRVALLSENRLEYLEVVLAAAKLGVVVACLNWRLSHDELEHCVTLVTPRAAVVSPRYAEGFHALDFKPETVLTLGDDYEAHLARASAASPDADPAEPEDGLLIIYTSGTTGLPKGALLSHRAELARMQNNCIDADLAEGDSFVAWPPMFHMASTDQGLHVLLTGGKVIVIDGFDIDPIMRTLLEEPQWWLILMPGMIDQVIDAVRSRNLRPRGPKLIGAMADLVPAHQIAEVTELLGAPYANTFGATETGLPPASRGRLAIGEVPLDLAKTVSSQCQYRLVDGDDRDVPRGTPGEIALRGPTLFSGYWNAPEVNRADFRGGWFHMGDCFVERPDGRLDFVDRVKYLIKSGGENIYPAEIERVILADARVDDAVVVRAPDERWGEVPVAFVARNDDSLTAEAVASLCLDSLARYKRPRRVQFVDFESLPRSTTGKIQRHEVEQWLKALED